jgi:hypothetical protein
MIQTIGASKDELQIIFRFHQQPSVDHHHVIVF